MKPRLLIAVGLTATFAVVLLLALTARTPQQVSNLGQDQGTNPSTPSTPQQYKPETDVLRGGPRTGETQGSQEGTTPSEQPQEEPEEQPGETPEEPGQGERRCEGKGPGNEKDKDHAKEDKQARGKERGRGPWCESNSPRGPLSEPPVKRGLYFPEHKDNASQTANEHRYYSHGKGH